MSESKPKFQKLTPIRNADIGIYSEALDFVFMSDDLRNIAVFGAYSAGKSSVLETYKAAHVDKKFIHISLAHFEEVKNSVGFESIEQCEKESDPVSKSTTVKESVLEGKILNQLIHQISPNRIPQTNFRTKKKLSIKKLVYSVIGTVAFILALFHVLFFYGWKNYVSQISKTWIGAILDFTAKDSFVLFSGISCVILAGLFLYFIFMAQANKRIFKKLSADKFEIEIFEGSEDSYFDKYLNEVLYLFDQCEADVVVFEDMDRYNANRIFERLREVNNLINAQRSKSDGAKPLRFFYLLRDDIFVSKDRTKFFDFIIPVVPVVDGSNSYDQFIKCLTDGSVFELFDEPFLQGLSLYIDDMRILKNICNEFLIYNSRLNIIELDHSKLMAMIAYKNFFPRDFNDLQLGRGFVFTLFDKKDKFITEKIARLEADIDVARARIEAVESEHLAKIDELNLVKANKLGIIENENRSYPYYEQIRQRRQNSIQELDAEYATRKQVIEDREKDLVSVIESNIRNQEAEIDKIKNESLREIITRENISEIFSVTSKNEIGIISDFKDIRGNAYFALLKYLIRNGYIDESYADYMTYFYEHSLSRTDKIFLRSIADQIKKEADYPLRDPHKVVARLDISVFAQPEVLNYDLLFYLLQVCAINMASSSIDHTLIVPTFPSINLRKEKEPQLLIALVEQILSQTDYSFIQGVFSKVRDERLNYLVNILNSVYKDFFERIITKKTELSQKHCNEFSFRTLIVTPNVDLLENVNFKETIASYVSRQSDFLSSEKFKEEQVERMFGRFTQSESIRVTLLTRLEALNINFQDINFETVDAISFEQVYKRSLYEINYGNISLMLKSQYGLSESDDFMHKNYTLIKMQADTPLAVYIEENINDYLAKFIAFCGSKICDNEVEVISILNNKDISVENKIAYIDMLTTVVQRITDVEDSDLWEHLLVSDLVVHTERNVLDYYCTQKYVLTDELIGFLNSKDSEYNYMKVRSEYEDEVQSKFFNSILRCNELRNGHYRSILKTLNRVYNKGFSVKDVANDKILILIDIGVIPMHKESLSFLREYYPNAIIPYIRKSISTYVNEVLDENNFDLDEALEVLLLSVADKHKLGLLKKITDPLTAQRQQYSDAIRAHILLNNLDEADIPHFIDTYPREGDLTKAEIEKIAINEIQTIFYNEYSVDKGLVDKLVASNVLYDIKLKLFALLLPTLDEKQCKDYLCQFELQGYLGLFEQKRPKIEITEINTRLLDVFQNKGWITKFEEDEKQGGYYRAFGRKVHKGNHGNESKTNQTEYTK